MSLDSLDFLIDDFDRLDNTPPVNQELVNMLFIGTKDTYDTITRKLKNYPGIMIYYQELVVDAIQMLLQNVYAIVFIENNSEMYDSITVSRIVRVNHPLARIIIISKLKNSAYISELVNNGSVEGFIHIKESTRKNLSSLVTLHLAKHDINKMIVKYISDPPKLSKASYLLLDPTLSFGSENSPVKYTGIMITYESVPRYSLFFEELLAKDEILFSGYLSGISLLGKELFSTKEPMREINFGGISVILRFIDDFQFFIFVRNLNAQNVTDAETLIDETISEIMSKIKVPLKKSRTLRDEPLEIMEKILEKFSNANDFTVNVLPDLIQYNEYIMIYGENLAFQEKIKKFLERKYNFKVFSTNDRETCKEELKSNDYDILLLDSELKEISAIDFAEYAKEISPHLQIIYRIKDMRSSDKVIKALNSTNISYLTNHRAAFKLLSKIIHSALKKAIEIKQQTRMGIKSSHDQAIVAKSMIRANKDKYLSESIPELHAIFITKDDQLIYRYQPNRDNLLMYDHELLGGVVASLKSIGEEALGEDNIGKIEVGGAHVLIQHREDYHFGFLIKNLDKNTSVVISKDICEYTDGFYKILKRYKKETSRNPRFAKQADNFHKFFKDKFTL